MRGTVKPQRRGRGEILYPQINKATSCSHSRQLLQHPSPGEVVHWHEVHQSPAKQDPGHSAFDESLLKCELGTDEQNNKHRS